jgi:hypothetical protein
MMVRIHVANKQLQSVFSGYQVFADRRCVANTSWVELSLETTGIMKPTNAADQLVGTFELSIKGSTPAAVQLADSLFDHRHCTC